MIDFPLDDKAAELERLRFALQSAQIGTWTLDIQRQQVWWDARCQELYGFGQDDIVSYSQVLSYMHPEDRARVNEAVQWALDPQSGGHYDSQFRTLGADDGQTRWLQCRGQADFDAHGVAYRFAGTAQDITQQVLSQQAVLASEARFRSLIEQAPVATSLFVGPQLLVEVANAPMLAIWGKGPNQIGRPFAQVLPELDNQPFLAILDQVYTSGETYSAQGARADLVLDGVLSTHYFDFTYKPLLDATGQVYAILQMAVEVTQQVVTRQRLDEHEAALRNAVELAGLGTWTLDVASGAMHLSPHHAHMFGLSTRVVDYETALAIVHPDDRERVRVDFEQALQPGSNGHYQAEYRILNATSGKPQLIRAKGETSRDAQGKPLRLVGTSQDVTLERESQLVLEQLVQQRTKELAATNEALVATNETVVDANQALAWANSDLTRSNQNLEQFAYIASHDLQEPLRKIQQFGDLLKMRLTGMASREELGYLERMQVAASRMSVLIKDLLAFSRIATTQAVTQPVLLGEVVSQALESLSVAIEESGAQLEVAALPTVEGDALQLRQLFQNLLSNALKFRRTSSTGTLLSPQIKVRAQWLAKGELPPSVKPARDADQYYQIEVIDNGIGFEEKYVDRIFQVFQRLHGKNEFAGTGVGLAIVDKVVTNHGGAIRASGKLNEGATFSVYLPG